MNFLKKIILTIVAFSIIASLSLALTGCPPAPPVEEVEETTEEVTEETTEEVVVGPKPGGTLIMAQWSSPDGPWDPTLYTDAYTAMSLGLIMEGLATYNENLELIPWLAESWEISEDQKEITFHIREGIKWHDGEDFTAEDVSFTFHVMGDPDYQGVRYGEVVAPLLGATAYKEGTADTIEGIEVIDPLTIKFTFEEVYAPAIESCGFSVIPKHIFEGNIGAAQRDFTTSADFVPIGTGPYKWVKYETDQYVELARNEDWWGYQYGMGANGEGTGKGPFVDTIFCKIMDQDTGLAAFLAGEVDAVSVPIAEYDMIAEVEFAEMYEVPGGGFQHFSLNQYKAPFNDVKFRQAVCYAINRQGIIDNILDGHGIVQASPIWSESWAHNPEVEPFPYDPEKAKELLDEAGYLDTDGDGIREYNGEPMIFDLFYPTGNMVRMASMPLIWQNLTAVGIEVRGELQDWPTLLGHVFPDDRKIEPDDFDTYLMGWSLSIDPDAAVIWSSKYEHPDGYNAYGYKNEETDALWEEGVKYVDPEKRKEIYYELEKILAEELPTIFLYNDNEIVAVNNRVKDVKIVSGLWDYAAKVFFDIYNVWIEE